MGGDEVAGFPPQAFPVCRYEGVHAEELCFTLSEADWEVGLPTWTSNLPEKWGLFP